MTRRKRAGSRPPPMERRMLRRPTPTPTPQPPSPSLPPTGSRPSPSSSRHGILLLIVYLHLLLPAMFSKQCNSFKTRAIKVKEGLESAIPGVTVHINPEKPRRGCFEIREEGGEVFISLLNMPRPFTPMKKLDMDEVINDVVKKIT
ncbi:uncharacterized protein [Typha angustifolia]|uniref:uncharacterized protein isoform X2 n=1 Tax=Typha angustifolia TaxID=59011 RepID=UPI003C2D9238